VVVRSTDERLQRNLRRCSHGCRHETVLLQILRGGPLRRILQYAQKTC
jgi:hypothetical protein